MSQSFPPYCIKLAVGNALEAVAADTLLMLLPTEEHKDIVNSCQPLLSKNGAVASGLPIVIGQTDGIALGVYLVFPFMHTGLHVCLVVFPLASLNRFFKERIGIGIQVDALPLAQYNTSEQFLQFGVAIGKLHIGPHLCSRVTQPHGGNIAGIDEGVVVAVHLLIVHGGLQRIGETVAKHPCQIGIRRQQSLHLFYLFVNGL